MKARPQNVASDDEYSCSGDDISEVTQAYFVQPSIDYPEQSIDNNKARLVRVNNLEPGRMSNVMTLNAKHFSGSPLKNCTLSESGLTRMFEMTPQTLKNGLAPSKF